MKTIRPVTWPQDHLRRASEVIAEQLRSGPPFDAFTIARKSCEAAVRNDAYLDQLAERRPPAFAKSPAA